jgi:hypothetical protein
MPSSLQRQSKRKSRGPSIAATHPIMDKETKIRIFESAKAEFVRHKWDVFEDELPSAGAGGSGATVSGCPACRKRINTLDQFFRHQSDDVLPVILRKAFEIAGAE